MRLSFLWGRKLFTAVTVFAKGGIPYSILATRMRLLFLVHLQFIYCSISVLNFPINLLLQCLVPRLILIKLIILVYVTFLSRSSLFVFSEFDGCWLNIALNWYIQSKGPVLQRTTFSTFPKLKLLGNSFLTFCLNLCVICVFILMLGIGIVLGLINMFDYLLNWPKYVF